MKGMPWSAQWRQFLAFCRNPYLAPRLRHVQARAGWLQDWHSGLSWLDLLKWAGVLWLLNMFVFGPVVVAVAEQAGAVHAVELHRLPWFLALIWAPLIEEMLFRFGLRRPAIALWLVPLMGFGLWHGPGVTQGVLFAAAVYLIYRSTRMTVIPDPRARRWLKRYRQYFAWVFHVSVLLFAGMHILNFTFEQFELWMLPVMVLPQWLTGLVLGWLRVMYGMGAAIRLHALFNLGPLLLAWLTLQAMTA
jgi:hypothetical protein